MNSGFGSGYHTGHASEMVVYPPTGSIT